MNFHHLQVFCEVEPKRRALKEANDELAAAHRKLASVEAKVWIIFNFNYVFTCYH